MTAVDFEMKPSWYKDPTWILRDATLFPAFAVAVKSPPGGRTLSEFSVAMNSMGPSKESVHYNGKSSYRTVLKKQPTTWIWTGHGFAHPSRSCGKHLILDNEP